jgi:hypothetical protein
VDDLGAKQRVTKMGRAWQLLAVVGLFGVVGCGPADEAATEVVEGGEGVTVEAGPPAEGATAELPPEIDVIPANE